MIKFLLTIILIFSFYRQSAQEIIFYSYNNIEVKNKKRSKYYGKLEYPTTDSNQVILTKFYKNDIPMSRTFYLDYRNRVKHDVQMLFEPGGKLAKTISYNFDTLHGPTRYYNKLGRIIEQEVYESGKLSFREEDTESGDSLLNSFIKWEDFPIFYECRNLSNTGERLKCSNELFYKEILKNVNYSLIPEDSSVEALVFVQFIVNEEGKIKEAKVVERTVESDMFDSCSIKAVYALPDFVPGTQYGEPISVQYTVPIHYNTDSQTSQLFQNWFIRHVEYRELVNEVQGVDRMPIWEGCELKGIDESEDDCTEWRMNKYIRKNVIYPDRFKKEEIIQEVSIRFTVNTDGKVESVKIRQGSTFDEFNREAIKVVKSFPEFKPAVRNDIPVSYDFDIRVRFKVW